MTAKTLTMKNPSEHPIHELLKARWSPYSFDPEQSVDTKTLTSLFEASRWSMSSYNAQPWRYIVANRASDEALWQETLSVLVEGNQAWAKHVPVLALGLFEHNFEYNGKPNKAAQHDLGAASAFMTLEATARGLVVHQMIGIEPDKAKQTFQLSDTIEPLTALAIGYAGSNASLDDDYAKRDDGKRERKPLSEILLKSAL